MKRILSLILAVLMVCTLATTAFATSTTTSFEIRETNDNYTAEGVKTMDSAKTELWLQVDAKGQIDVTVPLVLVFKTDINGGTANTSTDYGITNNSTADLVVTNIAVAKETTSATSQPMTMVAFNATLAEDQYKAQLSVEADVVKGEGSNGAYDLNTASYSNDAIKGGLFELKKAAADGTGTKTTIKADMVTGALSFVTSRTKADELDTTMGVKLLTVTYTVSVDTSDAIGSTITTTPNNPATNG